MCPKLCKSVAFGKKPHFLTLSHTFPGVVESVETLEFRRRFTSVALSATLKSVAKRKKGHAFYLRLEVLPYEQHF